MKITCYAQLLLLLLVFTAAFTLTGCTQESTLTVGVSTTLSGPAALWGESFRNGIELAREDLAKQGIPIEVVYMDDQLSPVQAVNNYNSLRVMHDPDVYFSTISRVAVPLAERAAEDGIPVFLTAVTAPDITERHNTVYRFFPQANGYVDPHMQLLDPENVRSIAIITVGDEYGATVRQMLLERAANYSVAFDEVFTPGTIDFRALLTKISQTNVTHAFFAGDPTSTVPALKQRTELGLEDIAFYDVSTTLLAKPVRDAAGDAAQGVYTIALPATLLETGTTFSDRYQQRYGEHPFYTAHFGYDMLFFLANITGGKQLTSDEIITSANKLTSITTLNGRVHVTQRGEINTQTISVRVVNNTLVRY